MKLEKYHGLGNDFLITLDQSFIGDRKRIISLCNRYSGIGADGFIIVGTDPLEMIFYNQDGTRGEMCGNGIRCFSMFCYNNGLIDSDEFDVVTLDGIKHISIVNKDPFNFKVMMGKMIDKINTAFIEYNNVTYEVLYFNFGVPHAVIFTNEFDNEGLGEYISNHSVFENKTNVNFVQILNENEIKIKTYERGVGFTKACGTGSCSSFITCYKLNKVNNNIIVKQELGDLNIYLEDGKIYMIGPACKVADIII
jgi:diaminopimelate epimerase